MTTAAELGGRVGLPMSVAEMRSRRWDAIVVGGGHNGLTTAAYLARAGLHVLVLERREVLGGAATVEQTWPGYRVSPCAYVVGLLHPLVVEELDLRRHGYRIRLIDPQLYVPFADGTGFGEYLDDDRTLASLRAFAPDQVDGFHAFSAFWDRIRRALRPAGPDDLWIGEPPDREQISARLGNDPEAVEALFDESIVANLQRFFTDQRMIDAYAGQGVIGTNASPFDGGTASIYFHHSSGTVDGVPGAWGYVAGGMSTVSFAIADSAAEAGAVIAAGVPVARIRPGEGVDLDSGDVIRAPVVVSNADPARTAALLDVAAPQSFVSAVEAVPRVSPCFKVTYALDGLPAFSAGPETVRAMATVTPGADAMHASYEAACRGEIPESFWAELYFQTAYDTSIVPQGKHLLSAFCQYVPYRFASGSWDDHRDEVARRITAQIDDLAPGFASLVDDVAVDGPPDVEKRIGLTGGHIFQGSVLPEHMWDRRIPYRTGAEGVYLCGSATHPGGSVIAINGRNAAMAVLKDRG